jgi:O-antigen biosynthesis protein
VGQVQPSVSVVICCYDGRRWDQLTAAVRSAQRQVGSDDEVIVVVDHNDELRAKVERELAGVTVIENADERGASGGRNTGAAAAGGEVLVFLDDDARAEPGWLERQLAWYADPTVLAVGGAAMPDWEGGERPPWLPATFDWVVGCTYAGQPLTAARVRNVWACNMSVRRDAFGQVGGFRTGIGGVRAGVTLGCEETELCIRLGQRGTVMYEPASAVRHFVPRGRQTRAYLLRRCRLEGHSKFLVARSVGRAAATATERTYARTVVASALRPFAAPSADAPAGGVEQSLLMLLGLVAAGIGYLSACVQSAASGSFQVSR